MSYRILLVDDDRENLMVNEALLKVAGYQVKTVQSGQEAIETIKNAKKDYALILMDYHMVGMSGAEAVAEIIKIKPNQQMLAYSLDDNRDVMRETFKAGVLDFLDKNSENEVLLSTVAAYCEKYEQNFRLLNDDDLIHSEKEDFIKKIGMIGRSEKLYELARQIEKIAPSKATTLIYGESGTGKELVARALHKCGDRASGPFVAVNIAAEQASLLDSSLFGHKKGSFTGATHDQAGKFQLANRGTIFLDEIGDMSLDLQVKLLRVLQEREITPVGATRPISVDVRIVAATHRDLPKLIAEGKFREDLYYRLSSVILETAPLRARPDDIEPLVVHFTREICKENGFDRSFHRRCLEVFREYSWKGNVRELRSVVERHLIGSDSEIVRAEDLEVILYKKSEVEDPRTLEEIDRYLDEKKRKMMADVMKGASSKAEAARRLGIAPNRLHYFTEKYDL
ncbi:MAG TPA: sigma-54 dependent transcriptional regulator [Pseudobdellovibrionaceae bacterium]|nr:sigma-54 dependent transcriptional regulator [Pseudobdellovibrionaceae bacterium]